MANIFKTIGDAATGGLFGLGSSLLGGLFGQFSQNQQNRYNKEMAELQFGYNKELMALQNQYNIDAATTAYERNLEQWNRQNAYNSPGQQMLRFKAAGLNPNLIYGQGSAGNANSSPQMSTPNVSAPQMTAPQKGAYDWSATIQNALQNASMFFQLKKQSSDAKIRDAEALLMQTEVKERIQRSKMALDSLKYVEEYYPNLYSSSEMSKLQRQYSEMARSGYEASSAYYDSEIRRMEKENYDTLFLGIKRQTLDNLVKIGQLTEKQKDKVSAEFDLLRQTYDFRDFDTTLSQMGLSPNVQRAIMGVVKLIFGLFYR